MSRTHSRHPGQSGRFHLSPPHDQSGPRGKTGTARALQPEASRHWEALQGRAMEGRARGSERQLSSAGKRRPYLQGPKTAPGFGGIRRRCVSTESEAL